MEKNLKNKHYGHIMLDGKIYCLTNHNPYHAQPCKLCVLEDECNNMGLLTNLCDIFGADGTEYFQVSGLMVDDHTIDLF